MNLLRLNDNIYAEQNIGLYTDEFNCGGFALGIYDWYIPASWRDLYMDFTISDIQKLGQLVEDMIEELPWLRQVDSPRNIPDRFPVIGFRLGHSHMVDDEDFHFILRENGAWYHKCGPGPVQRFSKREINEAWINRSYIYDSDIVWFAVLA